MGKLIGLFFIVFVYILAVYNSLVSRRNKIKQARSSIDVYLMQRFDLIPNLVECVKGYMKHEKNVIEKVTELRSSYNKTKSFDTGVELNNMCNSMIALSEKYPDLKASEQFLELQKSLSKMENQLQAARRLYNSEVTVYNTQISTVPRNFIAKFFGFTEEQLFQADIEAKENINIEL